MRSAKLAALARSPLAFDPSIPSNRASCSLSRGVTAIPQLNDTSRVSVELRQYLAKKDPATGCTPRFGQFDPNQACTSPEVTISSRTRGAMLRWFKRRDWMVGEVRREV